MLSVPQNRPVQSSAQLRAQSSEFRSATLTRWPLKCFPVMSHNGDPATTCFFTHSAPAACLDMSAPFFSRFPPPPATGRN